MHCDRNCKTCPRVGIPFQQIFRYWSRIKACVWGRGGNLAYDSSVFCTQIEETIESVCGLPGDPHDPSKASAILQSQGEGRGRAPRNPKSTYTEDSE